LLTVVHDAQEANDKMAGHRSLLDEIVRDGTRADGRKELVVITDGYRESTESGPICCVTANGAE
jgi:hypothetical protein